MSKGNGRSHIPPVAAQVALAGPPRTLGTAATVLAVLWQRRSGPFH